MPKKPLALYSAEQAAERLGNRGAKAVRNLAARHNIGQQVSSVWVFTDEDIDRLRQIPTEGGRPTTARVVRHRWGPEEEGTRTCKHCGAVSTWDGERWTAVESCR